MSHATSTPSNPTGTTSSTGVMMGLGQKLQASASGIVHVWVTGDANSSAIGDGGTIQLRYGLLAAGASPPANGAALTGTTFGNPINWVSATAAEKLPFCAMGLLTGFGNPFQTYWFDVSLAAVTGGTATIADVTVVITEPGGNG